MVAQVPFFFIAIYGKSLALIFVMAFYIGVISIGRFVNGYILLTELVPERH